MDPSRFEQIAACIFVQVAYPATLADGQRLEFQTFLASVRASPRCIDRSHLVHAAGDMLERLRCPFAN